MKDERRPARNAAANSSAIEDGSNGCGRRAPALVIRLEIGQAPTVVADWDDDAGDEEFTAWLDECPRIANVAYMAVALAEDLAA